MATINDLSKDQLLDVIYKYNEEVKKLNRIITSILRQIQANPNILGTQLEINIEGISDKERDLHQQLIVLKKEKFDSGQMNIDEIYQYLMEMFDV